VGPHPRVGTMADTSTQQNGFIVFTVAGTSYALPSGDVQHIEMVEQVTRVPNAAPFVDGVVFSRGQVIPAVNLRARFGFDRAAYDLRTRLIVVQSSGRCVGLLVDEGREFIRIPSDSIEPPQESLAGLSGRYVHGIATVGGRLILILQLDQLLTFAEPLVAA
jgi:chemotaxis signal transduction protein